MSLTKTILNAEYRLLRAPTRAIERRFLRRLPEESIVRMGAEGGLGAMDALAGRVTGNVEVRERGTAMIEAVKSSMRARADANLASNLNSLAETERSQLYTDAERQRREAARDVAAAVDDTAAETVRRQSQAAFSASTAAEEKVTDIDEQAGKKRQAADDT